MSKLIGPSKVVMEELQSSKAKGKKQQKAVTASSSVTQTAHHPLWTNLQKATALLLSLFVLFHLIWPLRAYVLTDQPEWTGIASRFSWRMKIQTKRIDSFEMSISDPATGQSTSVDYTSFVSVNQLNNLANDPTQIVQLAKYLDKLAVQRGFSTNPEIRAKVVVSMNGRPAQTWIDPKADLTNIDETSRHRPWILPLKD